MKKKGQRPEFQIRSFIADYRDKDNNYYHSVHQIMFAGNTTDKQSVLGIREFIEGKGFVLIVLCEIFGECSLSELQGIVNDPVEADFLSAEPRYLNIEEARKAAV